MNCDVSHHYSVTQRVKFKWYVQCATIFEVSKTQLTPHQKCVGHTPKLKDITHSLTQYRTLAGL